MNNKNRDNQSRRVIKNNYEFELEVSDSMKEEIESFNEYLEFIFENCTDDLKIERVLRDEETTSYKLPQDFYDLGLERGTRKEDTTGNLFYGMAGGTGIIGSQKTIHKITWVEWKISTEHTTNNSSFDLLLTPFLFSINTTANINTSNGTTRESEWIQIFTDIIYDKWSDKIIEIFKEKKKRKVSKLMNISYKSLGIDRQAKIKSILE